MKHWVKVGLGWGIWMFAGTTFFGFSFDSKAIILKLLIAKLIFWILGGLFFGYISVKFKKYKHVICPNKKENF